MLLIAPGGRSCSRVYSLSSSTLNMMCHQLDRAHEAYIIVDPPINRICTFSVHIHVIGVQYTEWQGAMSNRLHTRSLTIVFHSLDNPLYQIIIHSRQCLCLYTLLSSANISSSRCPEWWGRRCCERKLRTARRREHRTNDLFQSAIQYSMIIGHNHSCS